MTENPCVPDPMLIVFQRLFRLTQCCAELKMSDEIYGQVVTHGDGRFTADVQMTVRCRISFHVRDRHLRGIMAVAKQQPSPFLHFFF